MRAWPFFFALALPACSSDEPKPKEQPAETVLDASLDLEARQSIAVTITTRGRKATATLVASAGFGVVPAGESLTGPARIDEYPEAGATLYTARLDAPAQAGGPCGDEPVSLALSLHSDRDHRFIAGGLTAYCGSDRWHGVPALEPLRISGRVR